MTRMIKLLNLILLTSLLVGQSSQAEIVNTWYVSDSSGSPVVALNQQGNVKWRKHYKSFGEAIDPPVTSNHIGYTGHIHDNSTGLTYMGARYYDPLVGRFMGMDPVGVNPEDPRTFNRYAYAANSPYVYVDPDGKEFLFTSVFRRDGDTSSAAFRAVSMGGVTVAASPNAIGLGLSTIATPFGQAAAKEVISEATGLPGLSKTYKPRKKPGADGGSSAQIIKKQNGKEISRKHVVIKDGKILHQHENFKGKHGGERQFPDEWTGTKTKNAPYENISSRAKKGES